MMIHVTGNKDADVAIREFVTLLEKKAEYGKSIKDLEAGGADLQGVDWQERLSWLKRDASLNDDRLNKSRSRLVNMIGDTAVAALENGQEAEAYRIAIEQLASTFYGKNSAEGEPDAQDEETEEPEEAEDEESEAEDSDPASNDEDEDEEQDEEQDEEDVSETPAATTARPPLEQVLDESDDLDELRAVQDDYRNAIVQHRAAKIRFAEVEDQYDLAKANVASTYKEVLAKKKAEDDMILKLGMTLGDDVELEEPIKKPTGLDAAAKKQPETPKGGFAFARAKKSLAADHPKPAAKTVVTKTVSAKPAYRPVKFKPVAPKPPAKFAKDNANKRNDPLVKWVESLLKAYKLTRRAFAKKVGINKSTVDHWCQGLFVPHPDKVRMIEKAFCCKFPSTLSHRGSTS